MFLSFVIFVLPAQSQVIKLRVSDYGWLDSFPILKPILDDYVASEEVKLNNDQPIKNPQRLMQGIANSTAMSSRGVGTDYVTTMNDFLIGFSLGAGADLEKDVALKDLESGLGGAAGLVIGKKIDDRLNVYANMGGLSHSHTFDGIADTDLKAEISTFNIGIHARYDLVPGSGNDWFGWGGVKTHFGYEYNYNELTFENELNEDLEVDLGAGTVIQGRLKGKPRYSVTTKTHSFPLGVSSDVRFLKIFSLFGGVGGDVNFGKAKGEGDVKASVFSPLTCTSGICTNLNLPEVEATGNIDAEEKVDLLAFRAFGGLQMNISHFSIYGMVNKQIGTDLLGIALGAKLAF